MTQRHGLLPSVVRLVVRTRALVRQTGRLLATEAKLAGQQAREDLLESNLRAVVLLVAALFALVWLVAMVPVVVILAVPAADRLVTAASIAAAWLLATALLAMLGLRRLRVRPAGLLRPWKEDLAWAVRLLRRVVS